MSSIILALLFIVNANAALPEGCDKLLLAHVQKTPYSSLHFWSELPRQLEPSTTATLLVRLARQDLVMFNALLRIPEFALLAPDPLVDVPFENFRFALLHGSTYRFRELHALLSHIFQQNAPEFAILRLERPNTTPSLAPPAKMIGYSAPQTPDIADKIRTSSKNRYILINESSQIMTFSIPKAELPPSIDEALRSLGIMLLTPSNKVPLTDWLVQHEARLNDLVVIDQGSAYLFSTRAFRALKALQGPREMTSADNLDPELAVALEECFRVECELAPNRPAPRPRRFSEEHTRAFEFLTRYSARPLPSPDNDLLGLALAFVTVIEQITPAVLYPAVEEFIVLTMERCAIRPDAQSCFLTQTWPLVTYPFMKRVSIPEHAILKSNPFSAESLAIMDRRIKSLRAQAALPHPAKGSVRAQLARHRVPKLLHYSPTAASYLTALGVSDEEMQAMLDDWIGVEMQGYPVSTTEPGMKWTTLIKRKSAPYGRDTAYVVKTLKGSIESIVQLDVLEKRRIEAYFYNRAASILRITGFELALDVETAANQNEHFELAVQPGIALKLLYKHGLDASELATLLPGYRIDRNHVRDDRLSLSLVLAPGGPVQSYRDSLLMVLHPLPDAGDQALLLSLY